MFGYFDLKLMLSKIYLVCSLEKSIGFGRSFGAIVEDAIF